MTERIRWLAEIGKVVWWAGEKHVVFSSSEFELILCPNPSACGMTYYHYHWTVPRWCLELAERLRSN